MQTSVRPVDAAVVEDAGPDGIHELGPVLQNRLSRLGHSLGCHRHLPGASWRGNGRPAATPVGAPFSTATWPFT
ncbi:MAG: hypothetical protein WBO17_10605, partial [Sphingorhabdus sp.]